jgi:hypothetical protein
MYVPGALAASARVLGRVATAVENFLDVMMWPDVAAGHGTDQRADVNRRGSGAVR